MSAKPNFDRPIAHRGLHDRGRGIIENTATNLGRNTVTTNYWTDASLTNDIANPLLNSISRNNLGAFLDPRPAARGPATSDFAAAPSGLVAANYRGAFGPGRANWASDWTALSEYGVMGGAGGANPEVVVTIAGPSRPTLAIILVIYVRAALGEEAKFSRTPMAAEYAAYRQRTGFFWPKFS